MDDRKRFAQLMLAVCELFGREVPSAPVLDLYWEAFARYTDDQVSRAFHKAVRTCKFFPKPAEIIELIEGSSEDRAALAWATMIETMERIGSYGSVVFEDPALGRIVELWGGWPQVCELTWDDLRYRQKEFTRLYLGLDGRCDRPVKLPGRFELVNRARGYLDHVPRPALVSRRQFLPGRPALELNDGNGHCPEEDSA